MKVVLLKPISVPLFSLYYFCLSMGYKTTSFLKPFAYITSRLLTVACHETVECGGWMGGGGLVVVQWCTPPTY
jgi:hypothetical protein